jgi:serine/threonine protein kinase
MSDPRAVDRNAFLANLRQSRLLTETQLANVLRELPPHDRGPALARALIEKELLTRFQAERLLAGRNTGFILGPYRILDQLGRGGMGRVFKAEHRGLKRLVALKVLAPKLLQSDRARALFLREVQAASQLVHPNVVAALDAGEVDGHHFLVLEYVDGPNLDQLVRKQGPLPVGLACDYVKQTAHGLHAAHVRGMVHRDIKPANLLVQRHQDERSPGLIKISDFGLARLQSPGTAPGPHNTSGTILTKPNTVMGTPDFLAPEQARDMHRADIRSDLYSLGCTLYYLLTGQVPFPSGTALEKLIRHSAEKPESIASFRSDVPAEVIAVVRRLMEKRPADRYQTPLELAAALGPFAVSDATSWASPPPSSTNVLDGSSSDEWSALASTAPSDLSPTPLNVPDHPRPAPRRLSPTMLVCLTAVGATLLAGFALLMALMNF